MFDMIKKLQEAKGKMQEIKTKLDHITVQGESAQGKVKVTANGNRKIMHISITDQQLLLNQTELENHLLQAVNSALSSAEMLNESEMKDAAGALIPGLGGLMK